MLSFTFYVFYSFRCYHFAHSLLIVLLMRSQVMKMLDQVLFDFIGVRVGRQFSGRVALPRGPSALRSQALCTHSEIDRSGANIDIYS